MRSNGVFRIFYNYTVLLHIIFVLTLRARGIIFVCAVSHSLMQEVVMAKERSFPDGAAGSGSGLPDAGTQMELPGTADTYRQTLENAVNKAVHEVMELETRLRQARLAERKARSALAAL